MVNIQLQQRRLGLSAHPFDYLLLFKVYNIVFFQELSILVVVDTYGDEYNFQCASITKGCKNQCYMHYAPISLASFWTLAVSLIISKWSRFLTFKMFTLMAPFLFFNNLLKWVNIRKEVIIL